MRESKKMMLRLLAAIASLTLLSNCQHSTNYTLVSHKFQKPQLRDTHYTTEDAQTFPYRRFIAKDQAPQTIIIAVHGFCGASIDYENLGNHLMKHYPHVGLYAYEVRGQGLDPVRERRGDIDKKENWYRDLETFTRLVRHRHPEANIIWQGESMGALILSGTYRNAMEQGRKPSCDSIIITSPVVGVRDDFPLWKIHLVKKIAALIPDVRISLEALSGGQSVQMTATSTHGEQSETNAWHIDKHTLRLLVTLEEMIASMNENARFFKVPTLVAHGGKDFFCDHRKVKNFYDHMRQAPMKQRDFYPDAHHLLMYDEQREEVIHKIALWVDSLYPLFPSNEK